MRKSNESGPKPQYELRPAKQVERRMIIDALRKLSLVGFEIEDYEYVGFGSFYFVDFILFHKFLGIEKMLSVEYLPSIENRVKFNKPYDFIDIEMKPISEVIPTFSADIKYLLWLDYDRILDRELLEDVKLATTYLSTSSILLITVDVEPPGEESDGPHEWMRYFEEQAGEYLDLARVEDFAESKLPRINVQILDRAIKDGLAGRPVKFIPLFNFIYADRHQMITIGGLVGSDVERRKIEGSKLPGTSYIRRNLDKDAYHIRVPRVTRKERPYLDSSMPCRDGWNPGVFEFSDEDVCAYREIYRLFPAYAELLL